MPINANHEFALAQRKYDEAGSHQEKLEGLKQMLSSAPSHKGAEKLRSEIKQKIARLKNQALRAKKSGGSTHLSIKKEGAARVTIVGVPNAGKSTLLKELTGANTKIANYKHTTTKPEIGTMDYKGIKFQIIELPPIVKNYYEKDRGLYFLSIAKTSDLLVILIKNIGEEELVKKELKDGECRTKSLIINRSEPIERVKERIWKRLKLIKIFTKQPGQNKERIPVALKKGSNLEDLAKKIHKDFVKKFRFARLWGKSAKFPGQNIKNLKHVLKDEDIVELHEK
jgi:uncharacterized protein